MCSVPAGRGHARVRAAFSRATSSPCVLWVSNRLCQHPSRRLSHEAKEKVRQEKWSETPGGAPGPQGLPVASVSSWHQAHGEGSLRCGSWERGRASQGQYQVGVYGEEAPDLAVEGPDHWLFPSCTLSVGRQGFPKRCLLSLLISPLLCLALLVIRSDTCVRAELGRVSWMAGVGCLHNLSSTPRPLVLSAAPSSVLSGHPRAPHPPALAPWGPKVTEGH